MDKFFLAKTSKMVHYNDLNWVETFTAELKKTTIVNHSGRKTHNLTIKVNHGLSSADIS